ncbi:hypothetical protein GNP80_04485 [Aliivibrio fischeri]|uniref:DUF5677 domain-containing protein n=1 Tax=Aliivibrio fischeri TaxID=668 RepID=UPI0012D8A115|nr:DUF5677 domain-containing protein [Aliivibrio fischeri]MUJ21375.1 hypothetical protein [Aliivibrio fischeri]MUK91700.1 hypothetical protein [Aliivibrio fischeri]
MIKARIVANAYDDYDLYKKDFNCFLDSTLEHMKSIDVFPLYWSTLVFKNWKDGINHVGFKELDEIFDELHQDVNASYYLASMGLYRTANMHLRSMIELSLQLLYFFEHPIELKKWKEGDFVIKHDKLKDYLKEYPDFNSQPLKSQVDTLIEQISKEWKHFSKHIHAESLNYFQTQKESDYTNSFKIADFGIWKCNFTKIINKINKLFLLFFSNQYKLFPSQNKDLLIIE